MTAEGWAVLHDGEILIRTVSPTQVAAAINFLHTTNWRVNPHAPDEAILEFFESNCATDKTALVKVTVTLKQDG